MEKRIFTSATGSPISVIGLVIALTLVPVARIHSMYWPIDLQGASNTSYDANIKNSILWHWPINSLPTGKNL